LAAPKEKPLGLQVQARAAEGCLSGGRVAIERQFLPILLVEEVAPAGSIGLAPILEALDAVLYRATVVKLSAQIATVCDARATNELVRTAHRQT
jgi:hypothetical protein